MIQKFGRNIAKRWFGVKTWQQAANAKRRLAILYAIIGWNTFGVAFYYIMKDKIPEDKAERRAAYSKLTGAAKHVHVYQVSGLTLKKEFDLIHNNIIRENKKAEEEKEQTTVTT